MGAGSAKGVNPENSEDADGFSTSSDHWDNDVPTSKVEKENAKNNNTSTNAPAKIVTEAAIASTSTAPPPPESGVDTEEKKEDAKKKARFVFSRKKEDGDNKVENLGKESETSKKDNADDKDNAKKDAEKKGFRIFNWSKKDEKKAEEKDETLDKDINDLEKTFDSLGIVGKSMWGSESSKKKDGAVDDIEMLEPMRKRKNVKTKGMNGKMSSSSSSNGSKRTFKFSWETEGEKTSEKEEEEEEWEYKAVSVYFVLPVCPFVCTYLQLL